MTVLRLSRLLARTLREDPADADTTSHRLLVRAGFVRRTAPGAMAWLPLGAAVLGAVEREIRAQMATIGGQEIRLPPSAPGRVEEVAALARAEISSYRDLPLTLYQIAWRTCEDARSRGGLLRSRDYLAHLSCSFDGDADGLQAAYNRHRGAYMRILDAVGLDYRVVAAPAGQGEHAEQFLAPAAGGEDTFVTCTGCDYAAASTTVRARHRNAAASVPSGPAPAPEEVATPDTPTVEALARRMGVPASATLKNLLLWATSPDGGREVVAVGVPGDRDVDLRRVELALAPARVELFADADFAAHPALVRGYVGPQNLAGRAFRYLADPRVAPGTAWVTGANAFGRHVRNLVAGRDFAAERYVDLVVVRDDDPCPACGGRLRLHRGIEVARIARIGAAAGRASLDVLGRDGRRARVGLGAYALGVTRLVAAVAEQHHDEFGLCWPVGAAPAQLHVVAAGRDSAVAGAAVGVAEAAAADGLRVLLDDRGAISAGVKFADAELIGVPVILVVGRGLAGGTVEVRDRRNGERTQVALADALDAVRAVLAGATS